MKKEKRRQRGTGSIFRKPPNKRWFIQFYKDGKRIRESTGLTDWSEAQKLLRQRLHEVDKNEYVERKGKPVRIEELFACLKEHHEINRPRSVQDLEGRWNHLGPVFGQVTADRLATDDIRHYIRSRQKEGAANATVNRELAALRRMFNLGRQCTPPKVRNVDTRHLFSMLKEDNVRRGFVEDADFSKLVAEAHEPWLRTFLELGFTYGWRKGELLGLRVKQVNLENRTIRLDVGTTKNGQGREVGMTSKLAELLRVAVAGKGPEDFVLTRDRTSRGKVERLAVKDFRRIWRNLCVRAGLGWWVCAGCGERVAVQVKVLGSIGTRNARFEKCPCGQRGRKYRGFIVHDLRRSAAKALRRAGVSESVIMQTGGWKTTSMLHRYAIVSAADQRAAMQALERSRAENPSFGPFSAPFSQKTAPIAPEPGKANIQ